MSSVWFVLATVAGFVAGIVVLCSYEMLSEELRDRVNDIPEWLIRCAGRRLSEDVRVQLVDEWTAELDAILDDHHAKLRPLTRLLIGIRYALGLLRAAGKVDCVLHGEDGTQPSFHPRIDLAVLRGAVPAVRVGAFGVGFGMAIGAHADVGVAAEIALGVGGGVGALMLGVLAGTRLAAPAALGVGLGAGLGAEFGISVTSLSLAFGGVLVATLVGAVLAHARDRPG